MSKQKREATETGPLPEVPAAPASSETRTAKDVTLDRRVAWAPVHRSAFGGCCWPPSGPRASCATRACTFRRRRAPRALVCSCWRLSLRAQAFGDHAITRAFDFNHEHPALMKNLYGLSYLLFPPDAWACCGRRPRFRFPAFVLAALLALILPLLCLTDAGAPSRGRQGVIAALSCFCSCRGSSSRRTCRASTCPSPPPGCSSCTAFIAGASSGRAGGSGPASPSALAIATKHNAILHCPYRPHSLRALAKPGSSSQDVRAARGTCS
jgi:hypothetical protein